MELKWGLLSYFFNSSSITEWEFLLEPLLLHSWRIWYYFWSGNVSKDFTHQLVRLIACYTKATLRVQDNIKTDKVRWTQRRGFTEFISHKCQYNTRFGSHGNKLEPRRKFRNMRRWDGKNRKVELVNDGAKNSTWANELSKPAGGDTFSCSFSSTVTTACSWRNVFFFF